MVFDYKKRAGRKRLALFVVPVAGVEPARCCHRGILNPVRLPVPSHRREYAILYNIQTDLSRTSKKKIAKGILFSVRNFVSIKCIDKMRSIVYNIKAFGTEVNMAE